MKGPSLDAIRKFKEQQERKKREEDEKKIQSKLSTLEHRAAQGDKKAKSELKKIEKIKEELNKPPEIRIKTQGPSQEVKKQVQASQKAKPVARAETDFEELMRLAKQNANQTKKPNPPPTLAPPPPEEIKKKKSKDMKVVHKPKLSAVVSQRAERQQPPAKIQQQVQKVQKPGPPPTQARPPYQKASQSDIKLPPHIRSKLQQQQQARLHQQRMQQQPHASNQFKYRPRDPYDEGEEEDEDDYESDGFVVDEEDDDIQDEVSKTIRSVFRYDRRRCDLREQELDRQYRAIGRVSTFEDLEREERRASKLAAAEDARALKEEEERKRLKKLRLKK